MTAKAKPKPGSGARSAARMAAVQALYQMDIAGTDLNAVIREFETVRFSGDEQDEVLAQAPSAEDGRFRVPPILGEEP